MKNHEIEEDYPVYKPIIYFYPEKTTELLVQLGKPENLTCTYPLYNNGWKIVAYPDGTLIDQNTCRSLYALYWEGTSRFDASDAEGFVISGDETIKFLEEKLEVLGLNQRESEEFIIYWLPELQDNPYNYIRFASIEEINECMPLNISVQPDSLIRVLMQYKPLEEYIEIPEQKLETPIRRGFTVVEWGGQKISE